MQRLCSVQNRSCVVLVGRAGFEPTGIFETGSFKVFSEHIACGGLRAQRLGQNFLRESEEQFQDQQDQAGSQEINFVAGKAMPARRYL